jgi:hypothetical protein
MTSPRVASILQLGVVIVIVSLLVAACGVTSAPNRATADSVAKTEATVSEKGLLPDESQSRILEQIEAILCDSRMTQQTPECEGYQHQKAGRIEAAIEQY